MFLNDAYLYDRSYFDKYYVDDKKRELSYLQERDRIYGELDNVGGNILDVGCGVGGFLDTFYARWTKFGVEPSDYAAEIARRKGITITDINRLDFESMDVVIFRGTLQHINKPMEVLAQATRVLKNGGLLVILATPDTDGLVYKIWGKLPPLDKERNWVVFGHGVLENILNRMGYDTKFIYPYWKTPYANPVSDFCKFFLSFVFGYRKFAFPGNMMECYSRKVNDGA
jgi:SAM-dependent methyltransferase